MVLVPAFVGFGLSIRLWQLREAETAPPSSGSACLYGDIKFLITMKKASTIRPILPPVTQVLPPPILVFAKFRQRSKGCTDVGREGFP